MHVEMFFTIKLFVHNPFQRSLKTRLTFLLPKSSMTRHYGMIYVRILVVQSLDPYFSWKYFEMGLPKSSFML
jgi:hypothetical protein